MVTMFLRVWRACVLVGSVAACALPLGGCMAMRFVPTGAGFVQPVREAEVVRFPTSDGLMLEGMMMPPSAERAHAPQSTLKFERLPERFGRSVVLFCHGVADTDESMMASLFSEAGFRVFQFDYRGFGRSDRGPLTNGALEADAVAALHYLRSRPDVDPEQIVIFGHSMGAGYAMGAGARAMEEGNPVRAVIVASGFSSWRRIANYYLPVIGLVFGGVPGPDPVDYAQRLGRTPLLVVHAADDHDVPVENAYRLFAAASGAGVPATLLVRPEGGHFVAIDSGGLSRPIIEFALYCLEHEEWTRQQREAIDRAVYPEGR